MKFLALSRRINRQQVLFNAVAVESLESRRLLDAVIDGSNFVVTGTGGNDNIQLNVNAAANTVNAVINGQSAGTFDLGDVQIRRTIIRGLGGNDTIAGSPLDERIEGGAGNDSMLGNGGSDTLEGGSGADTFKGGAGNDTADYSARTANLTIGLGTMNDDGEANEKDNVATDVETVFGGSGNDSINGSPSGNLFVGGAGNDTLMGKAGNDTLVGIDGNDSLLGEDGNDKLVGNQGNDTLNGGGGTDSLDGGGGTNALTQGEATQIIPVVLELPSRDWLVLGTNVADEVSLVNDATNAHIVINGQETLFNYEIFTPVITVYGYGGNDDLRGYANGTIYGVLNGGAGNDFFDVDEGFDATVFGNEGNDTISLHNAVNLRSTFDGGPGTDTINTAIQLETPTLDMNVGVSWENAILGTNTRTVIGTGGPNDIRVSFNEEPVTIFGNGGNDTIVGGNGSDSLVGGGGNDSVGGGAGNDTLSGDEGTDTLNGEAGTDTAVNATGDTLISIENSGGGGGAGTAIITAGRTLLVTGTENADSILLTYGLLNSDDASLIVLNGVEFRFKMTDFDRVQIDALGGDDAVDIDVPRLLTAQGQQHPITVNLGGGDDRLDIVEAGATINGGDGDDAVFGVDGGGPFNGGAGTDFYELASPDGSNLDLTGMPTVENARINFGTLIGNGQANILQGGPGSTLRGAGGNDTITGSADDDGVLLEGGEGNDQISVPPGSNGNATLRGNGGNDTLLGGNGDDLLDGGTGADVMAGSGGNDTVDYSARTGNVIIGLGTLADDGEVNEKDNVATDIETILGGGGNDTISAANAGTAANLLVGNGGNDSLVGGGGNDTLSGNAGTDTLNGGDGTDTATNATGDTLISIENPGGGGGAGPGAFIENGDLIVLGTDGADSIQLSADHLGDPNNPTESVYRVRFLGTSVDKDFSWDEFDRVRVYALGSNDSVDVIGVTSFTPTIVDLGDGNDHIDITSAGPIDVIGGAGNDGVHLEDGFVSSFTGGAGRDSISDQETEASIDLRDYPDVENAQAFAGSLIGNSLDNELSLIVGGTIHGLGGNDTLMAGDGEVDVDVLDGGEGNDSIVGYFGSDSILGGGGNDTIEGGDGADTIDGGAGDDFIDGGLAGDFMKGGGGNDTVTYASRSTGVRVGIGTLADDGDEYDFQSDNVYLDIETVIGGSGNDTISGGAANNRLVGNGGNDSIKGNYGDDTLVGGAGTDTLNGENGTDTAEDAAGDILISIENS